MSAEPAAAPSPGPPVTAGETTAERPWPVRLLAKKLGDYIDRAPGLWVEGQVVQLVRRPGQSLCYLTLRDTDVDMSFQVTLPTRVLDALEVPLADGARVVVHARPRLWAKRGSLSLAADDVRPVGIGELLARIEHLRRLLAAEGLFDPARKRPLPFLPALVGLVCGRASAAERDVVENARRRWPQVRFETRTVAVQGPRAVLDVSAAIEELDAHPEVDVIVVARGGGSLEDLLAFSNETLVRAAAACRTPLVSAIGHEVDTPLLDLVADLRASTPTDAARRIVPDVAEERARLAQARQRLDGAVRRLLDRERQGLAAVRARPVLADPHRLLEPHTSAVLDLRERGLRSILARVDRARDDTAHLHDRVRALSPAATLARGYAVLQRPDGAVVRSPEEVRDGELLRARVAGGEFAVEVRETDQAAPAHRGRVRSDRPESTPDRPAPAKRRAATARGRAKATPDRATAPDRTGTEGEGHDQG